MACTKRSCQCTTGASSSMAQKKAKQWSISIACRPDSPSFSPCLFVSCLRGGIHWWYKHKAMATKRDGLRMWWSKFDQVDPTSPLPPLSIFRFRIQWMRTGGVTGFSYIAQVVQLCECMGKTVSKVVDDYVAQSPMDEFRHVPLGFEEYCTCYRFNNSPFFFFFILPSPCSLVWLKKNCMPRRNPWQACLYMGLWLYVFFRNDIQELRSTYPYFIFACALNSHTHPRRTV
jgi:hypothetical protein